MNKFDFLWIWSKILNRTSSTVTLNVGTVNMILLMLITVVKVFLTNLVTKPNVGDVVRWISRLTISMEPRGPRACGLLPRLRLSIILLGGVCVCMCVCVWGGGGWGVLREGLASPLGRGSNAVKVPYATLLRDCGVFIFNLFYYAPLRAGGLAL